MFEGFTKEASDFFWELAFNNERSWFLQHKQDFERLVNVPLKALAQETAELMEERFPEKELSLHVSRIYRDARRLHGRGPYKDHMWFSLRSRRWEGEGPLSGPSFWFELGAADYRCGLGFYSASAAQMAAFRKMLDADPARFRRIAEIVEKDRRMSLAGDRYVRAKGWQDDPLIGPWYNSKKISVELGGDFGGPLLRADLPEMLADVFGRLMPLYAYLMELCRLEPGSPRR